MSFFDDFEKYLKDSLIPGTDAYEMEEMERESEKEQKEHNEWLSEYHSEEFEDIDIDYDSDNSDAEDEKEDDDTDYATDCLDFEANESGENFATDNFGTSITLSFSVDEPREVKLPEDFFKYYNERYSFWDLRSALFDNFTELKQKYQLKKYENENFEFILENEYKKDRLQALKYWEWLLDTFPFESVVSTEKYKDDPTAYKIAVKFLQWLLAEAFVLSPDEKHIDFLYSYIKNNEKQFKIMFVDLKWKELDDSGILDRYHIIDYFRPFVYKNDYGHIRKMYQAITENQAAYFNDENLDEFWETLISNDEGFERSRQGQYGAFSHAVGLSDDSYDFFMEMIKPIKDIAKKSRRLLKDYAPDDTLDSIENEIEEIDIEIKGLLYKKEMLLKRLKRNS